MSPALTITFTIAALFLSVRMFEVGSGRFSRCVHCGAFREHEKDCPWGKS